MTKNLKFILVSLMLGFGLASCINHDIEPLTQEQMTIAQYDHAFVNAYGYPAPQHTWGFGVTTRTMMSTRAIANDGGYTFPNDADASKFLTEVPAGVPAFDDYSNSKNYGGTGYDKGVTYIDETIAGRISQVNVWGAHDPSIPPYGATTGGTLYIKGNCDFSNKSFKVAANTEIYLIANATLTLNAESAANLQEGCMIYVAEGAKIVTNSELVLNKGLHIYNHGTIEANKISTNSNSVLYNVGTITVVGKISVENDLSVFVNDGTLTAGELNTAGSGKIQNNGEVTIAGTTTINSNGNTWVNNGQYVTDDFKYTAGSDDVKNNCKLTVKKEFYINLGDCNYGIGFYVDGGVVAGSFKMEGPGYIYLGTNSVFKVDGTATMNCTKAKYGIYGIGTEWAVFQADEIVAGAANQEYLVTYGGKLAVVTNSHFSQGTAGGPYYAFVDGAVLSTETNVPEINIPETECNPGFVNKGTGTNEPTVVAEGRVFCEDLGVADDFDFNDVVFDVWILSDGNAKITLLAAGGTLPISVAGEDVHVHIPQMTTEGATPYTFTTTGKNYQSVGDVEVVVSHTFGAMLLTANQGQTPQKICVPIGTPWAKERIQIGTQINTDKLTDKDVAYPKFKDWVANPNVDWLSEFNPDKVVK